MASQFRVSTEELRANNDQTTNLINDNLQQHGNDIINIAGSLAATLGTESFSRAVKEFENYNNTVNALREQILKIRDGVNNYLSETTSVDQTVARSVGQILDQFYGSAAAFLS